MKPSQIFGVVGALLISFVPLRADQKKGTWVAIVPPALEDAVMPLAGHRQMEGWEVRIQERDALGTGDELGVKIRDYLQTMAADEDVVKPVVAVLAGIPMAAADADQAGVVPSIEGDFLRMNGVAADSGYSLKDGKRVADLSVGRLPARNADELEAMIAKMLKFESEAGAPRWKTRLSLIAGSSGGGPLADGFVGQQLNVRLKSLPSRWTIGQVADLTGSLFNIPRKDLNGATKELLEGGQLFSCYIGHAAPWAVSSGSENFFTREDFAALEINTGAGVFLTCGCESLAVDVPGEDGHGFAAMRSANGPAAFIGAEHLSYAAIGLLAFDGLANVLKDEKRDRLTLADCWQSVYGGIDTGEINPTIFMLMDRSDGSGAQVTLVDQRKEHLQMWMLLGDPAMTIPLITEQVELKIEVVDVVANAPLKVYGKLPHGWKKAAVHLTAERTIDSKPPANSKKKPNQFILTETKVNVEAGSFETILALPAALPGKRIMVRALAESEGESAQGAISIAVKQPDLGVPPEVKVTP
jgi:hypothetical protein